MMRKTQFLDLHAIKPSIEMGAFEALWASGLTSFKQLREKLSLNHATLLSDLIEQDKAKQFYEMAHEKFLYHF
jgi:hypothetical protein